MPPKKGKKGKKNAHDDHESDDDAVIHDMHSMNISTEGSTQSVEYPYEADCDCGYNCVAMTSAAFKKNWQSHQLICPLLNAPPAQAKGSKVKPPPPEPNFDNYIEIEGFETTIPPNEVDATNQRSYVCKYGCTGQSGMKKYFLSKYTFLEHIARVHPRVRIVLESPPDLHGHAEGTRTILNHMDPSGA